MTSTGLVSYLLVEKPFDGNFLNRAVVLEELVIIVLIYHILCFTDFMPDVEVKHDLGFSFIAVVMNIMIVYNFFGLL